MGFRQRLVLFLVVTLVGVQVLTAYAAYSFLRSTLVERSKDELVAATGVFKRQLDVLSERAMDDVLVLSLDYALRQAIAQNDYATEISVLRNHGNRVGAKRMMLIGLDGIISADTVGASSAGQEFKFSELIAGAATSGARSGLVSTDGAISWVVVVPVRAPETIAYIAAFIPVDNTLLDKLRSISSVPRSIGLATPVNGQWTIVARNLDGPATFPVPAARIAPAVESKMIDDGGQEYLTHTARLDTAGNSDPTVAVLAYSLNDALSKYQTLYIPLLIVLAVALIPAIAAAMLIAGGVSRPLEKLAVQARRIASGDYSAPEQVAQHGEIGQLSEAFGTMTACIAQREAALNSAVASMEVARSEAVRANEAKSQFLANMSHELRTPLNAIVGFGEMLQQEVLGPIGNARYIEYAKDICFSGQKLLGLVSRMLDLSDLEKGSFVFGREDFAPEKLVRECLDALRGVAEAGNVSIQLSTDGKVWPVLTGDTRRLFRAVSDLLHNAIRFSHPGSRVVVEGRCTDKHWLLSIADNGIGMAPEDLARVTKPFHRLRAAFDGANQGAGLGLPFAKAVIEAHGGNLSIESSPGEGTRVEIRLPLISKPLFEAA